MARTELGSVLISRGLITQEKLEWVKMLKSQRRGRISEYADEFSGASFHENQRPWRVPCDAALPCATQNELLAEDARTLLNNGTERGTATRCTA